MAKAGLFGGSLFGGSQNRDTSYEGVLGEIKRKYKIGENEFEENKREINFKAAVAEAIAESDLQQTLTSLATGQEKDNTNNFEDDELTKFFTGTLNDLVSDVSSMTRKQLKVQKARIEQLSESLESSNVKEQEFLQNQFEISKKFLEAEFEKKNSMAERAKETMSNMADQYIDFQAIYSGFFQNNPMAMLAFKLGGDMWKSHKNRKKEEKILVANDIHKQQIARKLEDDKVVLFEAERERAKRLEVAQGAFLKEKEPSSDSTMELSEDDEDIESNSFTQNTPDNPLFVKIVGDSVEITKDENPLTSNTNVAEQVRDNVAERKDRKAQMAYYTKTQKWQENLLKCVCEGGGISGKKGKGGLVAGLPSGDGGSTIETISTVAEGTLASSVIGKWLWNKFDKDGKKAKWFKTKKDNIKSKFGFEKDDPDKDKDKDSKDKNKDIKKDGKKSKFKTTSRWAKRVAAFAALFGIGSTVFGGDDDKSPEQNKQNDKYDNFKKYGTTDYTEAEQQEQNDKYNNFKKHGTTNYVAPKQETKFAGSYEAKHTNEINDKMDRDNTTAVLTDLALSTLSMAKSVPVVGPALGGVGDGGMAYVDGESTGTAAGIAAGAVLGGSAGLKFGATVGAAIGTAIPIPGVGSAVGAAVGGFIGMTGGGILGAMTASGIFGDTEKEKNDNLTSRNIEERGIIDRNDILPGEDSNVLEPARLENLSMAELQSLIDIDDFGEEDLQLIKETLEIKQKIRVKLSKEMQKMINDSLNKNGVSFSKDIDDQPEIIDVDDILKKYEESFYKHKEDLIKLQNMKSQMTKDNTIEVYDDFGDAELEFKDKDKQAEYAEASSKEWESDKNLQDNRNEYKIQQLKSDADGGKYEYNKRMGSVLTNEEVSTLPNTNGDFTKNSGNIDQLNATYDNKVLNDRNNKKSLTGENDMRKGGEMLGSVSEKYESGGRGAGTISSGRGDPGGVSYGTYQLASKTGTLKKYLDQSKYKEQLGGDINSKEFKDNWKKLAKDSPKDFEDDQHNFIYDTHYKPVKDAYKEKTGMEGNIDEMPGLSNALWSQSVQHGLRGNKKIIGNSLDSLGDNPSEKDRIESLYNERGNYVSGLNMNQRTKSSVLNRYKDEVGNATALVGTNVEKSSNNASIASVNESKLNPDTKSADLNNIVADQTTNVDTVSKIQNTNDSIEKEKVEQSKAPPTVINQVANNSKGGGDGGSVGGTVSNARNSNSSLQRITDRYISTSMS